MYIKACLSLAITAAFLVSQPFTVAPGAAQQSDKPTSELGAILQELRAIRLLLERPVTAPSPAPERDLSTPTTLPALTGPFLGEERAPLTMVEFSDLQCPFCQRFAIETFGQLKRDWIDTGRLRYVVLDFPLDFHVHARSAAHAVRCAGEQSRAWEMRTFLTQNAGKLSAEFIQTAAATVGVNTRDFGRCQASKRYRDAIDADVQTATSLGVSGTPTFLVGRSSATETTGVMLVGIVPYDKLNERLKASLAVAQETRWPGK